MQIRYKSNSAASICCGLAKCSKGGKVVTSLSLPSAKKLSALGGFALTPHQKLCPLISLGALSPDLRYRFALCAHNVPLSCCSSLATSLIVKHATSFYTPDNTLDTTKTLLIAIFQVIICYVLFVIYWTLIVDMYVCLCL